MSKALKTAKNDMITGALSILFAVLFFWETFHFSLVENLNTVDAAFVPRIIAGMVVVCATVILLRGYLVYRKFSKQERVVPEAEKRAARAGLSRIGQVFAVLLLAAITFKKLGFLLTMPWMMFLLFIILETKEKRNYKLYLIISIVAPILAFVAFYYGFSNLLPVGILKPVLSQFL